MDNQKYLIIAGCSYRWKCDIESYPDSIPEAFLKGYKIINIDYPASSMEFIKESIIHKISELLSNGVDYSNIYLLSNLTNIGRYFVKYPNYMLDGLEQKYIDSNKIGKYVTTSLIPMEFTKSKKIESWEKTMVTTIQNSRLPIQFFEIYLESLVVLQTFLKKHNIAHTLFLINNIFEGWHRNFKHTYSSLKGPIIADLSETLHISKMSDYCKYLWDLIDLDNFVFHKTAGNNYGGIDEYAIDKFSGDEFLYATNPKSVKNYWYGQHPYTPVYTQFSNDYNISDKIIKHLK